MNMVNLTELGNFYETVVISLFEFLKIIINNI